MVSLIILACGVGYWTVFQTIFPNDFQLDTLLASGEYSIIAADHVTVRDDPSSHGLFGRLRTVELINPQILSIANPTKLPVTLPVGTYIVVQKEKDFGEDVESAIRTKTQMDAIMMEKGLRSYGDGVPYIIPWRGKIGSSKIDLYRISATGKLENHSRTKVTHILIKQK